jgi:microcystin-dependent protein
MRLKVGMILPQITNLGNSFDLYGNTLLSCNGQTISTTVYSELYTLLQSTTVPNINGNNSVLRGVSTPGTFTGNNSITLTTDQIPSHFHNILYNESGTSQGGVWGGKSYNSGNYGNTTVGTGIYAGTAYAGGSQSIDI